LIEYILDANPDDRILKRACDFLKDGKLVVVPTDTNWVFLGDPYQKNAVEKLYRLKREDKSHHFSLMVDSISTASELAEISDAAFKLIRNKVPGHYTFIFEASKKMTKVLKASKTDHQVGLRFVPINFLKILLELYGGPLISTNIHQGLMGREFSPEELYSYEIEDTLGNEISMIIDPGEPVFIGPSTIYDLRDEEFVIIREGMGPKLF
jgi:tRNA threonylcarbamoyl adenosine modification protein (Sua5/YciO/YrdC/YwlC family)